MFINLNLLIIIAAGLINGSFVIPSKYIQKFSNEQIWIYYSVIGLIIIPWLILIFTSPQLIHNYLSLPIKVWIFMVIGGAIFGIGQVFFIYAIHKIGIALSFVINIGIGIVIGSMYVIILKKALFTYQGYLVILAIILILVSLVTNYYSGKIKAASQNNTIKDHYHIGWLLASLAGISSGFQNITFVFVAFHTNTQFQGSNSFWVWPPFLFISALIMILGFTYQKQVKENVKSNSSISIIVKNLILITIMGLFFTGSLALYSIGMSSLSHLQQIVGWPLLMVFIILASQMWGYIYRESSYKTLSGKFYQILSIFLLVIAIVLLSMAK